MGNSMMCFKEYEWVLLKGVVANQAFKNTQRAANTLKRVFIEEVLTPYVPANRNNIHIRKTTSSPPALLKT